MRQKAQWALADGTWRGAVHDANQGCDVSRAGRAAITMPMAAVVVVTGPVEPATPPTDCGKRVRLAALEPEPNGSVPQPRCLTPMATTR